MRCSHPYPVGFKADGKTIAWSPKQRSKEYATFQLPCGKCLECRLEYARSWAIRCVHEAQMHPKNCFITLTYEKLESDKLIYSHFQDFMKRLREHVYENAVDKTFGEGHWKSLSKKQKKEFREKHKFESTRLGCFVTGEYGDKEKRPHWHAIIFNWEPSDAKFKRSNERGDKIYESATLTKIWGKGLVEYGAVTLHSAGYCARYAAKKLVHGNDQEHDFHPISKKSNKHAIGKKWLEQFWPDVFNHGEVVLKDGTSMPIPRYYEKWLKENKPTEWLRYVTSTKQKRITAAETKAQNDYQAFKKVCDDRSAKRNIDGIFRGHPVSQLEARKKILREKFKLLQDHLKL